MSEVMLVVRTGLDTDRASSQDHVTTKRERVKAKSEPGAVATGLVDRVALPFY